MKEVRLSEPQLIKIHDPWTIESQSGTELLIEFVKGWAKLGNKQNTV